MDLVESGAIFNFKPFSAQTSRDNGKDDTFNSSSKSVSSRTNSRFEELFLASPRAQELVSTIDQSLSFTTSKSKIYSPYKQQTFPHESFAQTPLSSSSNNDKSTSNLSNSGLVVNMLEVFKSGQQPRTQQSTLFSPLKGPDFDDDSLRMQVKDVINKLRTPAKDTDGTSQSVNVDSGYDDRTQSHTDSIPDGITTRSDIAPSAVAKQTLPGVSLEQEVENNYPVSDPNSDAQDIDIVEHDQQSNAVDSGIKTTGDNTPVNKPEMLPETEEEFMDYDLIPGSDVPEARPKKDETKKPLPAEPTSQLKSEKKAHHLFGWYIKPAKTKNVPCIIVEGQRREDPVGELWHSTGIVNRKSPSLVETRSKSQYVLEGEILAKEALQQGFSKKFVKAFNNGFPSNWEQLVKEHFGSILNSSTKDEKQYEKTGKSVTKNQTTTRKTTPKTPINAGVKPIEVELKRTSSGRLVKPPLAWWRGQRIVTDRNNNLTSIEPGGEEHTALSIGLYDFDLKLPKDKATLLSSKAMTPKVAKYDVTTKTTGPRKQIEQNTIATANKAKSAKEKSDKTTAKNKKTTSLDGSESELTDSTSNSVESKIKDSTSEKTKSSSQAESDMSSLPGIIKPKQVMSDESWRPSESDSTVRESRNNPKLQSKKSQPKGKSRLTRSKIQNGELSTEEESDDDHNAGSVEEDNKVAKEQVKRNISFSAEENDSNPSRQKSSQKKGTFALSKKDDKNKSSTKQLRNDSSVKKVQVVLEKNQYLTRRRKQMKDQENRDTDSTIQSYNTEESDAVNSSEDIFRDNNSVKHTSKMRFRKTEGHQKKKTKMQSCTESSEEENAQPRRSLRKRKAGNQEVQTLSKYKGTNKELDIFHPPQARFGSRKAAGVAEDGVSWSSSDEEEAQEVAKMLSSVRQRKAESQASEVSTDTDSPKKKQHNRTRKKSTSQRSKSGSVQNKNLQKEKNLRKENGDIVDERDWKDDEIFRLSKALHSIPLSTPRYWQKVSDSVQTRTAQECQLKYDEQLNLKPRKVVKPKEKQPKANQKVVAITGGVGTIKRKRELRQLIQQNNDGFEDDIFESTPYKNTKKKFKFLVEKDQDSDDDDDDNENDDDDENDGNEEQHKKMEFKTPSSRTPSSRYRPLGPEGSSLNTPSSDLISPSLLQPVNREGMDHYIHRMKQSKKGVGQYRKADKMKVVKTSTPKKKGAAVIPKADRSIFDVQEVLEQDSDEENDYYWSDE